MKYGNVAIEGDNFVDIVHDNENFSFLSQFVNSPSNETLGLKLDVRIGTDTIELTLSSSKKELKGRYMFGDSNRINFLVDTFVHKIFIEAIN